MRRNIFTEEHDHFRSEFRRFANSEIVPSLKEWNQQGQSDPKIWRKLGESGYLGASAPEEYGGAGADLLFDVVLVVEELADLRAHAVQLSVHSDICMPYLTRYGDTAQKEKFLTSAIDGSCVLAIAMTEPGTGSDLANIQTRAIRDGDEYVINGAKTFISNGQNCGLVIVVARTDVDADPPHRGISLILVEAGRKGFEKGRNLKKLGLKGQDTSELFFNDCRVPVANRLGEEGQGLQQHQRCWCECDMETNY